MLKKLSTYLVYICSCTGVWRFCASSYTQPTRENSHGAHLHPVNHLIQAEVDLFMHNHSKVQASDLSRLERTVKSATKQAAEGAERHHQRQYSARTASTPRSASLRSTGASTYRGATSSRSAGSIPTHRTLQQQQQQQHKGKSGNGLEASASRSRPRPSTAGSATSRIRQQQPRQHQTPHKKDGRGKLTSSSSRRSGRSEQVATHFGDGGISVPNSIKNEWLILDTYQQLMADEKQAEEDRQAQEGAAI